MWSALPGITCVQTAHTVEKKAAEPYPKSDGPLAGTMRPGVRPTNTTGSWSGPEQAAWENTTVTMIPAWP